MRKWGLGNRLSAEERLLGSIQAIPAYPDVVPALRSLARKFGIAIISNTEDVLIAETVRGLAHLAGLKPE